MVTSMSSQDVELKPKDYKSDFRPDWCAGCGDYGIVNALQQSLSELHLKPHQVVVYSGVGCSSKTPHFVKTYGVHTLHGRGVPFAMGTQLANPDLHVIATGGDGDGYGIGAGHFLAAGRRNVDMTYIVYDNEVYGLTKGQASPTLKRGEQPKSLPLPNPNDAINPLAIAISAGYTFVARSYAYNPQHLKEIIKRAILHKGMSIVDVLQPCPTYNNLHTREWYAEEIEVNGVKHPRLYDIEEEGYNGKVQNPSNEEEIQAKKLQAIQRAQGDEPRIALGVFYQVELPTFLDRVKPNIKLLNQYTSSKMPIESPATHKPLVDLSEAYAEVMTNTY